MSQLDNCIVSFRLYVTRLQHIKHVTAHLSSPTTLASICLTSNLMSFCSCSRLLRLNLAYSRQSVTPLRRSVSTSPKIVQHQRPIPRLATEPSLLLTQSSDHISLTETSEYFLRRLKDALLSSKC